MLSSPRRRALPAAVLATALSTTLLGAAPASAQTQTQTPAPPERAAAWLAGQLSPAGTVVGSFPGQDGKPVPFTDHGRTLDAAIALLVTGTQPNALGRALYSAEQPAAVGAYTQGRGSDAEDAAYAGATAKLAYVVELSGGDATRTGGVDLLAQLASLATAEGRFTDRSDFGDFANLFGHAFALLAQDAAGRTVPAAQVDGLTRAQCADGGFPERYVPAQGSSCTSSVDATGLVLQALAALRLDDSAAARSAVTWLEGKQSGDGAFPGEVPVNATGYAAAGLLAVDADSAAAAKAVGFLRTQQNADGGLTGGEDGTSDLFATAQALPALGSKSFLAGVRDTVRRPPLASTDPLCDGTGPGRFSDVPESDVHAAAIGCMASFDVARGFDDGTYGPRRTVTRAQTAGLLARALTAAGVDLEAMTGARTFEDVPAGHVHREAISDLAALGVVRGRTQTTFAPEEPVQRDQMAALLARAYQAATGAPLPAATPAFTDADGVHRADIGRITDAGISTGVTATTYAPERPVARGAMASFVARTLNLVHVAGQPVQKPARTSGS